MVDAAEWEWITESASGDWEHVVLATSLPLLLPRGIHALEAWNEAVCDGAWGKRLARLGERRPPRRRPGALGGVRRSRSPLRAAAHRAGRRDTRPPARLGHRHLRRHPPQLPGARGPAAARRPQRRLPGGLLAAAQHPAAARSSAVSGWPPRARPAHHHGGRPAGRGAQAADRLADQPRALVRQHAGLAGVRRPGRAPRLARAVTDAAGAPCLQPVSEARLS